MVSLVNVVPGRACRNAQAQLVQLRSTKNNRGGGGLL